MSSSVTAVQVPSYRMLSTFLLGLSLLAAIGGITALLATKWMLVIGMTWVVTQTALPEFLLKSIGAVALSFSYLLYAAARDPIRNVVAINAFILLLVLVVAVELYSTFFLGLAEIYPATLVWGSIALRTLIAAALIAMRPRTG